MIGAIVLAAGRSRRMGTQKLLLPFHGQPMIVRIVEEVLQSPVDPVIVVVGREAKPIDDLLRGRNVQLVTNIHLQDEMLVSVRCGVAALPRETSAFLVILGDQPSLTADLLRMLIAGFSSADRGIIVPTHAGKRGHPLLISMRYREEILTRFDGQGLRGLLAAHSEDVLELAVTDAGILEDLDYPADYAQCRAETKRLNVPAAHMRMAVGVAEPSP